MFFHKKIIKESSGSEFESHVYKISEPLRPLFDLFPRSERPYLAAGAMRAAYNQVAVDEEDKIKDFDLYFPTIDHYQKALKFCESRWQYATQHPKAVNKAFDIGAGIPELQLISEYYVENLDKLFERFDWTVVMSAFDGNNVYSHKKFKKHNEDRELHLAEDAEYYINVDRGPTELLKRAMKYAAKGYFLPQDTIDKIIAVTKGYPKPEEEKFRNRVNS